MKLGKYETLEELGHGGMATVYRARDTHLDRFVALKVLHPHLRGEGEARSRFAREARSVARLEHPNIVRVLDYAGEDSEVAFLAVELLTGPTLAEYRRRVGSLPAEVAAAIALAVARALAAAHAQGIIHRDVKPENVLLHRDETVKLTDFGVAHIVDAQGFTATGQILGSPGHMAPEQIEHGACDARSDLFSLGTVLYFLLTGHLPFEGKNPHHMLRKVVEARFVDPRRWVPAIPAPLVRILARLLERDPAARFGGDDELIGALGGFLSESGIDDPDALLARFFSAPERVREELRGETIAQGIAAAERDLASGRRGDAIERLDYVLALEDGHPAALALLRRAARRARISRALRMAGPLVLVMGLGIAASLYAGRTDERPRPGDDAQLAFAPPDDDPPPKASPISVESADSVPREESEPEPVLAEPPDEATEERERRAPRRPPVARGPRRVVFSPAPQNVKISVNGEAPRAFGPSFRGVELTPGTHRFEVIDQSGCCEDLVESVRIPPSREPFVYRPRLPYKPARLYLVSSAPAEVEIRGPSGVSRGRTREILSVPMDTLERTVTYTVTADEHRVYTGRVRLRAGKMASPRVDLEPAQ